MSKPGGKADESSLKDRLRGFFRIKPNQAPNVTFRPETKEIIFTPELLKEIGRESPLATRVATIRALNETVATKRLEKHATERLWLTVCDLIEDGSPDGRQETASSAEARQAVLKFLECLIRGQSDQLEMTRAVFFDVIARQDHREDLPHRLGVFRVLSDEGRDLTYFEERAGELLLRWIPDVIKAGKVSELLALLINIIKHNSAYMDQHIVVQFVHSVSVITHQIRSYEDMEMCLGVLDAIVCYSYLPSEALYVFILTLCRMLNIERFSLSSLKLMRNLLGTHLGHGGIRTMCAILQDRAYDQDPKLLRGAVYFIGMALWGSRKVASLKHPPSAVLPCFLTALRNSGSNVVAHEIVLSLHRLVKKYGRDQHLVSCQIILDTVEALRKQFKDQPPDASISGQFHELLTCLQDLCDQDLFQGDHHQLYTIVERCASDRPESSVVGLLNYKGSSIHPSQYNWIQNLINIMDHYFRQESRTLIRKEALAILSRVVRANRHQHGEDLIENVVLVHLRGIDADPDVEVRADGVQLLIELAKWCQSQQCAQILAIIEKSLKRPLTAYTSLSDRSQVAALVPLDDKLHADIEIAAYGLVSIFETKLYQLPSCECVRAFGLLLSVLDSHYQHHYLTATACNIRGHILDCLLKLRADPLTRMGLPRKDGRYYYSPYILCDSGTVERVEKRISVTSPPTFVAPSQSPVASLRTTLLNYQDAFSLIVVCLEKELDWPVLKLVLENLPNLLQNKTLVLSAHSLVQKLCKRLYILVSDRKLEIYENLCRKPSNLNRSQFHCYILPILASLASYHLYLDKQRQKELLYCLDFGLVSKCARVCVSALGLCMLEMQEVMTSQLPAILQRLSQITPTPAMASPMLEFLSSLIRLPKLYASFVAGQYISIFAIALPYTNPFKFAHYTVSLAHHVIAMWFIKCRLPFRKDFVSYINRGLKGNVLRQFEETSRVHVARMNQDSSDSRRRLRSFGEYTSGGRPKRPMARANTSVAGPSVEVHSRTMSTNLGLQQGLSSPTAGPLDEEGALFHKELTETCLDMMARYTFSSCSSMPKRSPVSEFILKDGQSQSWLVGNKIVTITTSGGLGKVNYGGLCEKCYKLCGGNEKQSASQKQSLSSKRRRHKSAAVTSTSLTTPSQKPTSQDDIHVYRQTSQDEDVIERREVARSASQSSMDNSDIPAADLLLGLRNKENVFSREPCSCWCSGWVEVYIRRPTGNVSWIMRIQNDQLLPHATDHFPLYDISALFRGCADLVEEPLTGRIDSESLGENEYETLYDKHFPAAGQHRRQDGSRPDPAAVAADVLVDPASDLRMDLHDDVYTMTINPPRTGSQPRVETPAIPVRPSWTPGQDSPSIRKVQSSPDFSADFGQYLEREKTVTFEKDDESGGALDIPGGETAEVDVEGALPRTPDRTTSDPGPDRSNSPFVDVENLETETDVPREEEHREKDDQIKDLPPSKNLFSKPRGHTISVMTSSGAGVTSERESSRSGMTPSFVFLQLYHSPVINGGDERPIALPNSEVIERAMKVLDHIPPYETHKIGVVYVGDGQAEDQSAILGNVYGSSRYADFLHGLGDLIRLKECRPDHSYVGGLDTSGQDGLFTYSWTDDVMQVIFHVATLMPTKETDPHCNAKKLHIGNDYVTIVYNNSDHDYKIGTIKGQFNYVNIVISPLDHGSNAVTIQCIPEMVDMIGQADIKVVSDSSLAELVRQVAVHANLASLILQRQKTQPKDPFASNWLERLRQIKRVHSKATSARDDKKVHAAEDFTDYVQC